MTTLTIEQEQWRDELRHGLVAPADPQIMWTFPTWDVSDMSVRDEVEHCDIASKTQTGVLSQTLAPGLRAEIVSIVDKVLSSYLLSDKIELLLGTAGEEVLNQLLHLVRSTAEEENWPLQGIEQRIWDDLESEGDQFLGVILKLKCSFKQADLTLKNFYPKLQEMIDTSPQHLREAFIKNIYIDVEAF